MSLIRSKRPSAAMIVAVAALSFALVGTAVAGPDAVSKLTKSKVKKIARKQADKELKANISGSHVNEADHAKNADNATNANNAQNAQSLNGQSSADFLGSNAVRAEGNADSADIDNFTTATYTTVLSEPFTAPSDGFALINASVSAADDASIGGAGTLRSRVAIDGTATTDDPFNATVYRGTDGSDGGTATNTVVVPVTAGDHTAHLQISETGTGSYIFTRQVTVLFVPNGDAGPIPYKQGDSSGPEQPR